MYSSFKTALDAYLAANWTRTPIYDFANNPGEPAGYDPWIAYKVVAMTDEVQSIAEEPHCILAIYGMSFSVYIGSAEGQALAISLAEDLKALFIGQRLPGNIEFREVDTDFGVKLENESSGKWYRTIVFVQVEHRYFI